MKGMQYPGRFDYKPGIDLVDTGEIKFFMLRNDNLYNICVPEACKGAQPEDHFRIIAAHGLPKPPIGHDDVRASTNPKHVLFKVIGHMWAEDLSPSFIDVGAFVGDVSLRYANFARTAGLAMRFYCFDPSLSGDLIPFNIELNGLGGFIEHLPIAVSGIEGLLLFGQLEGSSDGSRAARGPEQVRNAIVRSMRLSRFLDERKIENAFIKLDTENMEQDILLDIREHLDRTINIVCFEFAHQNLLLRPVLSELGKSQVLYDIGYVPTPFCCRPIDPANLEEFYGTVSRRPFGYTDVMAISRRMPGLGRLQEQLSRLVEYPPRYSIVFDDPGEHRWEVNQAGQIDLPLLGRIRRHLHRIFR